jgi:hypothetical protein
VRSEGHKVALPTWRAAQAEQGRACCAILPAGSSKKLPGLLRASSKGLTRY